MVKFQVAQAVSQALCYPFWCLALVALCAASSAHAQQPPPPKVHELGKGVYVFEFLYSNAPFVITDDGVLVMDTYNPFYAKELRKAIEARTDKPVRYVVYSHAHTDHVRGANEFKDTAQIIAQRRQVPRLEYIKEDSFPMPDILFDKEYRIVLGGKEIYLKDYGINHATGVTVMYIPENKLVTAIDIAYVKRLGYYFMPDFNPRVPRPQHNGRVSQHRHGVLKPGISRIKPRSLARRRPRPASGNSPCVPRSRSGRL